MVVQETQWCRDGEVLLPECPDQSSNPAPYCCLPAQTIPEPVTVDNPTREDGDAGANCVCRGGSKRCKTKELGKTSRAFADQWAQWKPMEARHCWGFFPETHQAAAQLLTACTDLSDPISCSASTPVLILPAGSHHVPLMLHGEKGQLAMQGTPAEPAAHYSFLPPSSRDAVSQQECSSHHPHAAAVRSDAGQIYGRC